MALFWTDLARAVNFGEAHWTVMITACGWEDETRLNPKKFVSNDDKRKKG